MDLPNEIIANILGYCDLISQLSFRLTCKRMSYFLEYMRLNKLINVTNEDHNTFYFNLLTNIFIDDFLHNYPKYLTI